MNMEPIKNFVPFPRRILSDVLNGRMSGPEFFVYAWIRGKGNPYAVSQVSIPEIRAAYPGTVSDNHIYKLIRSLRKKKYLYYPDRAGRRGSFEVHMGEWTLPDGSFKTLERFFVQQTVRTSQPASPPVRPEVRDENKDVNQGFEMMKKHMAERFKLPPSNE